MTGGIRKALYASLTASVLMFTALQANAMEVNRAMLAPLINITKYNTQISFWREVCTKEDVTVEVSKTFSKMSDSGNVESYYRDNRIVKYFFEGSDKCYGEVFTVDIPDSLPNGKYLYEPKALVNGKYPLLELPTERLLIHR